MRELTIHAWSERKEREEAATLLSLDEMLDAALVPEPRAEKASIAEPAVPPLKSSDDDGTSSNLPLLITLGGAYIASGGLG